MSTWLKSHFGFFLNHHHQSIYTYLQFNLSHHRTELIYISGMVIAFEMSVIFITDDEFYKANADILFAIQNGHTCVFWVVIFDNDNCKIKGFDFALQQWNFLPIIVWTIYETGFSVDFTAFDVDFCSQELLCYKLWFVVRWNKESPQWPTSQRLTSCSDCHVLKYTVF